MKSKLLLGILLLLGEKIHSQIPDYKTAIYIPVNGGWISTLKDKDYSLPNYVDLRYINELFRKNKLNESFTLLKELVTREDLRNFEESFRLANYIYNERKFILNNKITWARSKEEVISNIKTAIVNKEILASIFPPSVNRGGYPYFQSETISNIQAAQELSKKIKNVNPIVEKIIPAKNGFILPILLTKNHYYLIYLVQINNSIFKDLNGLFEISSIYDSGNKENTEIFSKWSGTTEEKELIYGIRDIYGWFEPKDKIIIEIEGLFFRKSPKINQDNIIRIFSKNEKVEIVQIGNYEILNGVGANWIKVKDQKGLEGWCFGSSQYLFYDKQIWGPKK